MQAFIYFLIFILLTFGSLYILGVGFPKKRNMISISKATAIDKRKEVDERFSRLSLHEKIIVTIKNTVTMSGFKMNIFWLFIALSFFAGIGDRYENEVDVSLKRITSLIEPIMIVFVGLLAGTVVISIFLPMFDMTSNMNV